MSDSVSYLAGEWVKPTTRTPAQGEIVMLRSKNSGVTGLGYFAGNNWCVCAVGVLPLNAVSEWAPASPSALRSHSGNPFKDRLERQYPRGITPN
jgi:hypothetical protein